VLNLERGRLQEAGVDVELRPKAFAVLLYLVERAGKLVSKDELVEAVWPDLAISDDSLAQCVLEVRRSLGDDTHGLIKTAPRRGYIFDDRVVAIADALPVETAVGGRSKTTLTAGIIGLVLLLLGSYAVGKAINRPTTVPLLLDGATTVIGEPIVSYPDGTPAIAAAIVPLPPRVESGWHTHPVPLFAFVLDGEVTVDYGNKGTRVYRKGDALLEAMDQPHNARGTGSGLTRILIVTMGAVGTAASQPAAAPAD
jgi:DNA-binding winged helix-turn-helix (wHTH) protein/quercetin dioxygenase-like cupin family protein